VAPAASVNRAVGVGAQGGNTSLPRAYDEFWARMSVRISFAGRNNRETWLDGGKEVRNSRVFAAEMADL
jgi:hypothetical protein